MNSRRPKYLIAIIPILLFTFISSGDKLNIIIKDKNTKAAQVETNKKRAEVNAIITSHNKATKEKVIEQKEKLAAIQTPNVSQYTTEEHLEFGTKKMIIQYNLENNITTNTDQSITELIEIRDRIEARFA
jgi:ABC-type Na+ efflux pump permease subunit